MRKIAFLLCSKLSPCPPSTTFSSLRHPPLVGKFAIPSSSQLTFNSILNYSIDLKCTALHSSVSGEVISEEYSLEYGTDTMEMHVGAVQAGELVLIIDDLIATGGTLVAAIKLLERVGAHVVECACVIELPELKDLEKLGDKP